VDSSATVANGVVYVGSDDHKVYAFDAAGTTNCSGTPKTCAPLWTATTGGVVRATPTVANGVLYAGSERLYAFDAAGTRDCSGTPKTCTPLWTGSTAGGVSGIGVAGSTVYVGSGSLDPSYGMLSAFTAAPSNCRLGTQPPECFPTWEAGLGSAPSSPAVANGVVYIGEQGGPLYAFDAAGKTGCTTGEIGVCAPLWLGQTGALDQGSSPAVANGVVYIGTGQFSVGGSVQAFDASGTTNCSGAPKVCNQCGSATATSSRSVRHPPSPTTTSTSVESAASPRSTSAENAPTTADTAASTCDKRKEPRTICCFGYGQRRDVAE
jgi:outer membrane protein assembly factor BamB